MPRKMGIHRLYSSNPEPEYVSEVATEEELLEFCNKVREAGGANVLEALLPSEVNMPSACLIANALNFGCSVRGFYKEGDKDNFHPDGDGSYLWGMYFPRNMTDEAIEKVAAAVDCRIDRGWDGERVMVLPKHIGNAAAAFDSGDAFQEYRVTEDLDA